MTMNAFALDGRRLGLNRRVYSYVAHIPERRSGNDRRSGQDRRHTGAMSRSAEPERRASSR